MPDQLSSDLASLKIDRAARPKRRSPIGIIVTLLLALGAAGAAYQYGLPYLESAVFKTEVEVTEVITVSPAQASVELTSTGYVVAQTLSSVATKVAGKVRVQRVKQGAKVKAGDVLLEIDTADQKAGIATADIEIGKLRIDTRASRVTFDGNPVKLTSQEYRLLAYLAHHRGKVVSRTELVEHLYDQDFDRDSNTIEVFVGRIRKKLGVDIIQTVRGLGYMLNAPDAEA